MLDLNVEILAALLQLFQQFDGFTTIVRSLQPLGPTLQIAFGCGQSGPPILEIVPKKQFIDDWQIQVRVSAQSHRKPGGRTLLEAEADETMGIHDTKQERQAVTG